MTEAPPPILFFAAGQGTRMRHLSRDRPKPLIEVAGRALIDHAMAYATPDLVGRRVVNVRAHPSMMRDHLAGTGVVISDETDAVLETGGGLRRALPLLQGNPVLTMNCDAIFAGPNPIATLRRAWRPGMGALLLCVPVERAVGHPGRGDFDPAPGARIVRGTALIYTGVHMIDTPILSEIGDEAFSLNPVWDILDARGTLHHALYPGRWCDVGQPESLPLAEALLAGASDV